MVGEERIALNEATFRELNEAIEDGRSTRTGVVGFLCECGVLGCNEVVELTISEYEAVRADGKQFFVWPGHDTEVDDVLERHSQYSVVAKRGQAGRIAERRDPRVDA